MGMPWMYSTFSKEKALGEVKRKVKSLLAPGKNAGNIMIDLAVMCFNKRHITTTINDTRSTLTNLTELDLPKIWNPY